MAKYRFEFDLDKTQHDSLGKMHKDSYLVLKKALVEWCTLKMMHSIVESLGVRHDNIEGETRSDYALHVISYFRSRLMGRDLFRAIYKESEDMIHGSRFMNDYEVLMHNKPIPAAKPQPSNENYLRRPWTNEPVEPVSLSFVSKNTSRSQPVVETKNTVFDGDWQRLGRLMTQRLTMSNIKTVCFDIGYPSEELDTRSKSTMIVSFCENIPMWDRFDVDDMIEALTYVNGAVNWCVDNAV